MSSKRAPIVVTRPLVVGTLPHVVGTLPHLARNEVTMDNFGNSTIGLRAEDDAVRPDQQQPLLEVTTRSSDA